MPLSPPISGPQDLIDASFHWPGLKDQSCEAEGHSDRGDSSDRQSRELRCRVGLNETWGTRERSGVREMCFCLDKTTYACWHMRGVEERRICAASHLY